MSHVISCARSRETAQTMDAREAVVRDKLNELVLLCGQGGQLTLKELALAYERQSDGQSFKREGLGGLKHFVSKHFSFNETTGMIKARKTAKKKKKKARKKCTENETGKETLGGASPSLSPPLSPRSRVQTSHPGSARHLID